MSTTLRHSGCTDRLRSNRRSCPRIHLGQRRILTAGGLVIDAPHPGHVRGALLHENVVDVAIHADVVARLIAIHDRSALPELAFRPWVPPPIHLVVESQEKWVSPRFGRAGPCVDVTVVPTRGNHRAAVVRRITSG